MAILLGPRGSFSVQAGRFRHRVTIQSRVTSRDSAGGPVDSWINYLTGVPAVIEPASGREFFVARQIESTVDTAITIRWRTGILPTMRAVHGANIYDITAVLPDGDSGRKTLTLMCTLRGAEGFRT